MNLVKCPFCGEEIENDSFYCDLCGKQLKCCPQGHGFKVGNWCGDCGETLVWAKDAKTQPAPAQPPTPAPQPAPAQPPTPAPQPAPAQTSAPSFAELYPEAVTLIRQGQKLAAVKTIVEKSGITLKEAKDLVDNFAQNPDATATQTNARSFAERYPEAVTLIQQGQKLAAVKSIAVKLNISLKEAKDIVDSFVQNPDATAMQQPAPQPLTNTFNPAAMSRQPSCLYCQQLNARVGLLNGGVVGRVTGNYLHIFGSQGYISGTHARFQQNASGGWEIVDLGSLNGTFVNGVRLTPHQPASLKIGDTVVFYNLEFTVQ